MERREEHNTVANLVELLNAGRERARKAALEQAVRTRRKWLSVKDGGVNSGRATH